MGGAVHQLKAARPPGVVTELQRKIPECPFRDFLFCASAKVSSLRGASPGKITELFIFEKYEAFHGNLIQRILPLKKVKCSDAARQRSAPQHGVNPAEDRIWGRMANQNMKCFKGNLISPHICALPRYDKAAPGNFRCRCSKA
ncbi:MAG: hypothetical protein BCS36_13735 [Desulfovibrio sp. MES5]|uniref:hypothetical protein n=1 Tax=Desulfovibrio sp. MES5 TaxID=1899016 RepID=UPI000B9CAD75|nr:hypothetical protein [Desulfovibrio sp. MES5]OXS28755.1 MAG: hypothetical protein BCS36_13735 [Desulfovibrio sp. MES5]